MILFTLQFCGSDGSLLMDFHSGTGTVYSADIRSIYGSWCAWRKKRNSGNSGLRSSWSSRSSGFAGFSGGIGALLGNAGGYIVGFIFSALVMWAFEHIFGRKPVVQIISMVVGLIVCYAFGTVWFMFAYTRSTGPVGLMAVLGWCVFPFIIPDLIKIALAYVLSGKVRKYAR